MTKITSVNKNYLELLEQITDQAERVRKLQKEYYNVKTRTQSSLINAKKAEGILDVLLGRRAQMQAEIKSGAPAYVQKELIHEVKE